MHEKVRNLACKSDDPPVEAEVRVEVKEGDEWVRIPVTLCELIVNKDGPSDLTRNAKVKFPVEWGGESISQYINGFNTDTEDETPYDECRIWFYDHDDDTYQIAHYGYIGGVGPASDTGVMKFIVYDVADLMRGIPVSKSFGEPTIQQIIDFVLSGTDNNDYPVGVEKRSVFSDIKTFIAGIEEVRAQKADTSDLGGEESDGDDTVLTSLDYPFGQFQLNVNDLADDIFDYMFGSDVTNGIGGQKRFQRNRDNMVNLMNWFAGEVGGKWHFEPTPDGPILFFDNTSARPEDNRILDDDDEGEIFESDEDGAFSRRVFNDDELGSVESGNITDYTARDAFASVDVIDNNALYDIKPFNTLFLYGESHDPARRYGGARGARGAPGMYTEEFPSVKVQYPPLVKRSGGYEYAAPAVESDKVTLDQAEKQAKKEFRKHLEEETEGSITTKGEPYILPYDYIRTIPTCNDTYPNANINPITYEVNSVKHTCEAGERYTSELGVSMVFDESLLTVESQYVDA